MKTLILTQGLPASGKSSWTREQEGAKTVSKDDLRQALHNGVFSKQNEKEVVETERTMVETWMKNNEELIIVDNTHIGKDNPHIVFYTELANKYGYTFELKTFNTSYEECIERDAMRGDKKVGWKVIKRMNDQLLAERFPRYQDVMLFEDDKKKAIIVDVDGTLAFSPQRSPYDYRMVHLDKPNKNLISLLNNMEEAGYYIIVVSGRDDCCKGETMEWLRKHNLSPDEVYMRVTGDKRKDSIVKEEIYKEFIEPKYNVHYVFDDRDQVVEKWRELGLFTLQCYYGSF